MWFFFKFYFNVIFNVILCYLKLFCCTLHHTTIYTNDHDYTSMHLHKHLWFSTKLCHCRRSTVATHGLAVSRELQSEVLVPQVMDSIHACCTELLAAQFRAVDCHNIHLLWQHNKCRLCCLTNLLIHSFILPINIVAMITPLWLLNYNVKVQFL